MRWLLDVLRLPSDCGVGFVTCATQANLSGLIAARHALLARQGWDVEARGLFGAPEVQVVVSEEAHPVGYRDGLLARFMLGLGRERVVRVAVDGQGRMRAECLPELRAARRRVRAGGQREHGGVRPVDEIRARARASGPGCTWTARSGCGPPPARAIRHLVSGAGEADSWATDAHKWLNVLYDSGLALWFATLMPARGDVDDGGLPARRASAGSRRSTFPSCRGGRGASRCGRR